MFQVNYRLFFMLLFIALTSCQRISNNTLEQTNISPNQITEIDTYLSQLTQEHTFSGTVLIAQDGEKLLNKGYGLADTEKQVPNSSQTRFRVHWITMQFTAMGILMLQADNKLNVKDPICDTIPNCPDYWQGLTIHHLLTHTSGLSEAIHWGNQSSDNEKSSLQFIELIADDPPYFPPGEQFRYSMNGYIVLGHIIEQASGQPYKTFKQQRIFEPLGMKNSSFAQGESAIGYDAYGTPAPTPDLLYQFPASGLYTTVEDLFLWDQALDGDQLVSQEYLDKIFTRYARTPSMDFKDSDYGYGWFIGHLFDRPVHFHGGLTPGYTAMLMRFPSEHVTIIVLRNYGIQIYDRLEIDLAAMIFGAGPL